MRIVVVESLPGRSLLKLSAAVSLLTTLGTVATPLAAQTGAMVQAVPQTGAVDRLNQNLNRLSRQPTDMDALIGAGEASYELGDAQAANGFYTRADMVNARDGRVKMGLALVAVSLKQPKEASLFFDEAEALGARADAHLFERAMTYDLTGQQDKAQRDYALALQRTPDNSEIIRAYAVSLGISGKVDAAEAQLRPLLYKSDRGAWRDRTMILAMNGRTAEARRIAQTIMPKSLADAMEPYLIRMGSLNPAQKAVASFYGQFPADGLRLATVTAPPAPPRAETTAAASRKRSRDRGRAEPAAQPAAPAEDSSLLAAMPHGDMPPAQVQPVPQPAPVPARAAPLSSANSGDDDPDGWTAVERRRAEQRATLKPAVTPRPSAPVRTAMAPATPAPVPTSAPSVFGSAVPVRLSPAVPPANVVAATPAPAPVQSAPAPSPSPAPSTVQGPLVDTAPTPVPQPSPAPAPVKPPRTLAAIMADITPSEAERAASAQAVDLAEVAQLQAAKRKAAADKAKKDAAAKAKAEAEAKAKAEAEEKARLKANPARSWVQVATGKDVGALAFDMRRLRKTYSALADEDGFTAEWGATRRLLVGPFTPAKAKAIVTDLKKAGGDGFVWQSEAGEVVSTLSGK